MRPGSSALGPFVAAFLPCAPSLVHVEDRYRPVLAPTLEAWGHEVANDLSRANLSIGLRQGSTRQAQDLDVIVAVHERMSGPRTSHEWHRIRAVTFIDGSASRLVACWSIEQTGVEAKRLLLRQRLEELVGHDGAATVGFAPRILGPVLRRVDVLRSHRAPRLLIDEISGGQPVVVRGAWSSLPTLSAHTCGPTPTHVRVAPDDVPVPSSRVLRAAANAGLLIPEHRCHSIGEWSAVDVQHVAGARVRRKDIPVVARQLARFHMSGRPGWPTDHRGPTHGDWIRRNLRLVDGSISAFDWEHSDDNGVLVADLLWMLVRERCPPGTCAAYEAERGFGLRRAELELAWSAIRHRVPDRLSDRAQDVVGDLMSRSGSQA